MTTLREDLLAAINAADSDRWLVELEQAFEEHGLRIIRTHRATAAAWEWLEAEEMDDERRARITATLTELDAELHVVAHLALLPEMCPHGLYVWMPCTRCAAYFPPKETER